MSSSTLNRSIARPLQAARLPGLPNATSIGSRHAAAFRNANIGASRSYTSSSSRSQSSHVSSRWLFASMASLFFVSASFLSTPLLADADTAKGKKPAFTKDQVGVVCLIGGPAVGKSTQLQNIVKRFDYKELKASGDLQKQLSEIVANASDGKKPRVIIEGFPTTIEQANRFETEVCPILLIISMDINGKPEQAVSRIKEKIDQNDAKINWKRFEDKSAAIMKKFRFQGNILEITGNWPADEVWEQVEAKLESALELDERGEL